jgi:hypothetical protein
MRFASLAWVEGSKMGQNLRKEEQYLLETAADFLTRMTELEKLRVAVRLAEVAKTLQSEDLQRRPINPKVVDLFSGPQLRVQPARPPATS